DVHRRFHPPSFLTEEAVLDAAEKIVKAGRYFPGRLNLVEGHLEWAVEYVVVDTTAATSAPVTAAAAVPAAAALAPMEGSNLDRGMPSLTDMGGADTASSSWAPP
ncbi:hypothetical protein HYH02_015521, partial [Chlamydomonas schloesseri]